MFQKIALLSLSAVALLGGCETVQMYEGPPKQPGEIGRLFTTGTQLNFRMLTLDGKPLTYISPRVLELSPGTHVLEIAANNRSMRYIMLPGVGYVGGPRYQKGNYRVEFSVRAGFTYAFDYPERYSGPLPENLCILGEPHDAPGSKENFTKELRTMSPKAEAAGCGLVQNKMNIEPPPAEAPPTSEAK